MDESLFPAPLLFALRTAFKVGGTVAPTRTARKAADLYLKPERHPRPPRENAAVDQGERITFNNGLTGFKWQNDSESNSTGTILLVHGWSGRATQMHAFIEPLLAQGYRVIALDLPAHGESPGETSDPIDGKNALLAVGNELGPLHAIIAHSFGSACSMWAIQEGMQVNHMISLGAPTHYIHRFFANFFRIPKHATEKFVQEISHRMNYPADDIDVEKLFAANNKTYNTPTLLIHGSNDVEMPVYHAEANAKVIEKSTLIVLDDCGHRKVVWDPRVVKHVVEWLPNNKF